MLETVSAEAAIGMTQSMLASSTCQAALGGELLQYRPRQAWSVESCTCRQPRTHPAAEPGLAGGGWDLLSRG